MTNEDNDIVGRLLERQALSMAVHPANGDAAELAAKALADGWIDTLKSEDQRKVRALFDRICKGDEE